MLKDQRDLLLAFNAQSVRFLIVGGHALGRYTEPRATKDLDVFVDRSRENAERVYLALAAFGAPLTGLTPADFENPYSGFQLGVPPSQVDIILAISALTFEEAWEQSVPGTTGEGIPVRYLSLDHLIRNKTAAGRRIDLADVENLENAREANSGKKETSQHGD